MKTTNCVRCGREIPEGQRLCYFCLTSDPRDSRFVKYPCDDCDVPQCRDKNCGRWKEWFFAKWEEVVRPLRRDGEI